MASDDDDELQLEYNVEADDSDSDGLKLEDNDEVDELILEDNEPVAVEAEEDDHALCLEDNEDDSETPLERKDSHDGSGLEQAIDALQVGPAELPLGLAPYTWELVPPPQLPEAVLMASPNVDMLLPASRAPQQGAAGGIACHQWLDDCRRCRSYADASCLRRLPPALRVPYVSAAVGRSMV
jgi:hypothetical protein